MEPAGYPQVGGPQKEIPMEMDRTSIIGIVLIMLLFLGWQYVAAPSAAEIEVEE